MKKRHKTDEKEHENIINNKAKNRQPLNRIADFVRSRKVQIIVASILTVVLLVSIPIYSWFKMQREMERFARINSPDTLFITAAHKEDTIYLNMGQINVNGYWDDAKTDKKNYQYYVFSVAGKYVTEYSLQLAHTTNNNYRYEIFEAEFTKTNPVASNSSLVDGKDFVSYKVTEDYPDTSEFPTIANRKDKSGNTVSINQNDYLYYTIRQDTGGNNVSLNVANYGETVEGNVVTSKEYTVSVPGSPSATETVSYDGHYLNEGTGFLAANSGTYYTKTYGSYSHVEAHAIPKYWLATGIQVDGSESRDPFYHEYILKISWDNTGDDRATLDFKDTDIICITAGVR